MTEFLGPMPELDPQKVRHSSIGMGKRGQFLEPANPICPGPSQYEVQSEFNLAKTVKGKTFGASRKSYENVSIPGMNNLVPKEANELPGPGHYRFTESHLMKSDKRITIRGRAMKDNTEIVRNLPSPQSYRLKYAQVEQERFNGVGFGVGNRFTERERNAKLGPGPGTYLISSPFDRYERLLKQGKGMIENVTVV